MKSTGRKLGFIIIAALLAGALVMPALSPSPSLADDSVTVYFRILGPDNMGTFSETGEYSIIWEGEVTVPTEVTITCTSGIQYYLFVDDSDPLDPRYKVKRLSDNEIFDRGPADASKGATSVLAALVEASQPENGNFGYMVSDGYFPSMGFFISAIAGKAGVGSLGWCYRVWNPDDASLLPMAADAFLLDYSTMPIDTPHQQVLWYWGGSECYPLRVTSPSTVAVGQEFTATVEYFSDYGHGPAGEWVTLAGATVEVGGESFITDSNGDVQIFLENEGNYEITASKGYDGSNFYVPTDDRTVVTVSGGDTSDWWVQTTEVDFNSGAQTQVDTGTNPGDVVLDTGGTVTEDYTLDGLVTTEGTLGGEYFYDQFEIINGATLYVTDGEPLVIHANDILVDATSKIDADGRGYDGGIGNTGSGDDGFGPGAGSGGVHLDVHGGGGGGASYSGAGGVGSRWWSESAAPGYTYGGSCESGDHTFYLGSGGGGGGGNGSSNQGGDGGDGGGGIKLEAATVNIYGTVTAQGKAGSNGAAAGCGGGGGGSGGTIYIACETYDIADGALWINGGEGGDGGGTNGHGAGGGGGGHIKVFYESVDNSSGHHASGGLRGTGDPYHGGFALSGSGVEKDDWKQETFSPTLPYYSAGTLESASENTGYTAADFGKIRWSASTPSGTGVKLQIATNKDNSTWNFVGPDGTDTSYYETNGADDIWAGHDGDQYIKYKAFFSTTEPGKTPTLSKVGITYTEGSITEVISFTVTDFNEDGINFGTLDPGQENQPADGQPGQGTIVLTVGSETNLDIDIQIKGDNFSGPDTIIISNVKYDVDADPAGAGVMTDSYATWYSVTQPLSGDDISQGYHWISIPGGQPAGDYTSTFYYQAIKSP